MERYRGSERLWATPEEALVRLRGRIGRRFRHAGSVFWLVRTGMVTVVEWLVLLSLQLLYISAQKSAILFIAVFLAWNVLLFYSKCRAIGRRFGIRFGRGSGILIGRAFRHT